MNLDRIFASTSVIAFATLSVIDPFSATLAAIGGIAVAAFIDANDRAARQRAEILAGMKAWSESRKNEEMIEITCDEEHTEDVIEVTANDLWAGYNESIEVEKSDTDMPEATFAYQLRLAPATEKVEVAIATVNYADMGYRELQKLVKVRRQNDSDIKLNASKKVLCAWLALRD